MSADSGNEVPDDERLEWLLSLDDNQFNRIQKVARGPVYTRRQIAKYLGTGAAAALAGGASTGAVAADASTSDSDGDVGTPSNPVDVFSDGVATESVEGIQLAEPGELQSRLSNASPGDEVWAVDGAHDPGSQTTVPQDVTLRFVGAAFEPTTDYDGFHVSHGARLYLKADVRNNIGSSYTSNVVTLDTGVEGNAYRSQEETDATVHIEAQGARGSGGTLLYLHSTGSGAITTGCEVRIKSRGFDTVVDGHVEGGFINFDNWYIDSTQARTFILHRSAVDNPFNSHIRGQIQPNSAVSEYGIRNASDTGTSVKFSGSLWDPSGFGQYAVEGSRITVQNFNWNTDSMAGNVSGSIYQLIYEMGNEDKLIIVSGGSEYIVQYNFDRFNYFINGTEVMRVFDNGRVDIAGSLNENSL